ncbi:FxLYD domain-containing protein [Streptomyces cyaneofuscatus]|uniref:FxLYD domain-containing protein n=1 Tax=Streptomyces cyaneofuscatus TaxID=66883 RepID=UPI003797425A
MMRRQMKLAAVLVVVVLALTGFSTSTSGGKGSKSKGSSSGGGGCSNSEKSNSGYRHNDYSDDDYDDNSSSGSSGSYGTPTPTASDGPAVRVLRCARPRKGKRKAVTASLVELRSNDTRSYEYEVDVTFYDARGNVVDTAETTTTLDAGAVRSLTVRMDSPRRVSEVKRCEVTAQLL